MDYEMIVVEKFVKILVSDYSKLDANEIFQQAISKTQKKKSKNSFKEKRKKKIYIVHRLFETVCKSPSCERDAFYDKVIEVQTDFMEN